MIETNDLILDKAKQEDWLSMYKNVWSRSESFQYMVIENSPNQQEAQARMERTIAFQQGRESYTVYLKSTREAIGFTGIAPLEGNIWEETGICIGPDFWGRGYGWQILRALLAHAKELGAKVLVYSSWAENLASRALAAKAGFVQYGTEKHVREHDGKEYTLLKFKLSLADKTDWLFRTPEGICHVRVAAVLIRGGRLLAQKSGGTYALPGGHLRFGETTVEALVRELKEEMGVEAACRRLLWTEENFWRWGDREAHNLCYYYLIDANGSAPEEGVLMRDNDSVTFHWLPIAELDGVEIYPTFLKNELPNLSDYPKHFIRRD